MKGPSVGQQQTCAARTLTHLIAFELLTRKLVKLIPGAFFSRVHNVLNVPQSVVSRQQCTLAHNKRIRRKRVAPALGPVETPETMGPKGQIKKNLLRNRVRRQTAKATHLAIRPLKKPWDSFAYCVVKNNLDSFKSLAKFIG